MSNSFEQTLNHIRSTATTPLMQGILFERLIKKYFAEDPVYKQRFSRVWSWKEWAAQNPDFDSTDTGIDLVAEERRGGFCAAQCKCYLPDTRISKKQIDSFIAASANEMFTSRIIVSTSDNWGPNARKTIEKVSPPCAVLGYGRLADSDVVWPNLEKQKPEDLSVIENKFTLKPHQSAALEDVISGFRDNDRGKMIMPCGTGKTFTSLRIAEQFAGIGKRTLYLVPSISLLAQTMREWATHKSISHSYIGICSDTKAGYGEEDSSIQDLEIPVTTDLEAISKILCRDNKDVMLVVFCTYQSLELVARAQDEGAPDFQLVLCDEAHRTTGVESSTGNKSPFILVHDKEKIRAEKRLYMTATPRLYTEVAKAKAARYEKEVFSMDDPETYGPEFHRLSFSDAVEKDLLSDFKVVVFGVSEQYVESSLQMHLASSNKEISITDAAKIMGCWRTLQNPENQNLEEKPVRPLRRLIVFTNRIDSSKKLEFHWEHITRHALAGEQQNGKTQDFVDCEIKHVDGKHNALYRKSALKWLKEEGEGTCRILTNAKCLSEGIDVPALDAVVFMSPKNSHVDIVQAVGRAMRKAENKECGYIILPVAVPAGVAPDDALDDNERFSVVWSVLRALRSHDEKFDAEINRLDLSKSASRRIVVVNPNGQQVSPNGSTVLNFPFLDLPAGAFYAKVVERCGDRKYWPTWAKDVAEIFLKLVERIRNLLEHEDKKILREWFSAFLEDLRNSINDSITLEDVIEMMAQHILTRPVFEALFQAYNFADTNPVAQALDKLLRDLREFGLEDETRDLAPFYRSVRERASVVDNSEERQRILMDLYENFFATAMKRDAKRLGIVYTPTEIVDFILHSADEILRKEFDLSLSDKNVNIVDPFTGTGIFLVRLIQAKSLVKDSDLVRKYQEELYANEIILLAYYIAAIHIEEAFHGRCGPGSSYQPFKGMLLTDTFNLHVRRTDYSNDWFPNNSKRTQKQQSSSIQVILGNPPYSAFNENVRYQSLDERIQETYKRRSTATLRTSLDDSYIRAIRWASDRIDENGGVIVFVTNGSFIDSNATDGVRACLREDFSTIYCLNLRGNQRTQGEQSRREGGKIFASGSRAPIAITAFVKNPRVKHDGCRILYHDIGDYMRRGQKLDIVRNSKSVLGIDWKEIIPNSHHDWINQRDESFENLIPLGEKSSGKNGGGGQLPIFLSYSSGVKTNRDKWVYSSTRHASRIMDEES